MKDTAHFMWWLKTDHWMNSIKFISFFPTSFLLSETKVNVILSSLTLDHWCLYTIPFNIWFHFTFIYVPQILERFQLFKSSQLRFYGFTRMWKARVYIYECFENLQIFRHSSNKFSIYFHFEIRENENKTSNNFKRIKFHNLKSVVVESKW